MVNKLIIFLSTLTLLIVDLPAQNYIKYTQEYCEGINISATTYTADELKVLRTAIKTIIPVQFSKIYVYLNGGTTSDLFKGTLSYLIILIILIVICFASFIIYFLYCCCFKQYQSSSPCKIKTFCIVALIFAILFVVCVIIMAIFVSKMQENYAGSNCAISRTPYDILEGARFSSQEYMGLRNLKQVMVSFSGEVSNLSKKVDSFTSISNAQLNNAGTQATDTYTNFNTVASGTTVFNAEGVQAIPLTIANFTKSGSAIITAEFTKYSGIATDLNNAAESGKTYGNPTTLSNTSVSATTAAALIGDMITTISTNLDKVATYMSNGSKHVKLGYYISLALSALVLLLSFIMLLILYCQFSSQRCLGMICPLKFLMSVVALTNCALVVISMIAIILLAGTSSFCKYNASIMEATDISAAITSSNIVFSTNEKTFYEKCLGTSPAPITSLLTDSDGTLSAAAAVINGISRYSNFQHNLSGTDFSSKSINSLVATWQKYASGLFFDFDDVSTIK